MSAAEVKGGELDRREVAAELLRDRGDLLVVTGLGASTYDAAAVADTPLNFYLWGAMGSTAMVGLGLAAARPDRRVLTLTGDGDMLMGLGNLATIGVRNPANLFIVILNNRLYGETGRQASHCAFGIRLDRVAAACGFDRADTIGDMVGVRALRERLHAPQAGVQFAAIDVAPAMPERVLPSRDGAYLKHRFRAALGVD